MHRVPLTKLFQVMSDYWKLFCGDTFESFKFIWGHWEFFSTRGHSCPDHVGVFKWYLDIYSHMNVYVSAQSWLIDKRKLIIIFDWDRFQFVKRMKCKRPNWADWIWFDLDLNDVDKGVQETRLKFNEIISRKSQFLQGFQNQVENTLSRSNQRERIRKWAKVINFETHLKNGLKLYCF